LANLWRAGIVRDQPESARHHSRGSKTGLMSGRPAAALLKLQIFNADSTVSTVLCSTTAKNKIKFALSLNGYPF
jgi:hypothetical protein